jgi:hypothetical protein
MEMQKSANGVLVLVLGILSFAGFGPLTGLPAWIIGNGSLRDIREGRADADEQGMVQAGRVLGMIACILFGFAMCVAFAWIGFLAALIGGAAASS